MSDAENKAVFLSYASQDAEAARRIADALRAAGVEVWFDQNELVGGDAWDAKIRKQIAECALFVPIISAATQARLEGYFRLEWKIAARRTHSMATAKAFLLPVVIDATRDADAHVPDEFREVQWTRLPGAAHLTTFEQRVARLLRPDAPVAARSPEVSPIPTVASTAKRSSTPLIIAVAAAILIGAGWLWWPRGGQEKAKPSTPAIATPSDELTRLRARIVPDRWQNGDFEAVDTTLERLIQQNPENSDAWALRSIICSLQTMRLIDKGTKPLQDGRIAAERAMRLAPDSPLSNLALGYHLTANINRGGDPEAGRAPMDRAAAALPPDALTRYGALAAVWNAYDLAATETRAREWLAAEPDATFPAWIMASVNILTRRPDDVLKWAARAMSDQNITGIRAYSTIFDAHYYLRADLVAATKILDQVPPRGRAVPRIIFCRWLLASAQGQHDQALQILTSVPEPFIGDISYSGPKALLAGLSHHWAGRTEPAAVQLREAERLLRERLATDSENEEYRLALALTLAVLDRAADARNELALIEPVLKGRAPSLYRGQLFSLAAQVHAFLGEADATAYYLRRIFTEPSNPAQTPASVRQDPRFRRIVSAPAVQALLTEFANLDPKTLAPETMRSPADDKSAPADKSVAVLAFANLSDDKANEYFSDGISEELLNVLAKVPGLKVTARTSAFHFKGKDTPIPEIARQLGVAYVVEGSVRKAGDKVRITAQLIKAADGFHVWSDTFTRDLKDIFAVQDEIAGLVARQLQLNMSLTAPRSVVKPEVHQLYLQGRFFATRTSSADVARGVEFYERVIAEAPDYAPAWAALARARLWQGSWEPLVVERFRQAGAAAKKALEIDPDSAEAHSVISQVKLRHEFAWQEAHAASRHAVTLAPAEISVLIDAAATAQALGRIPESIELARRAIALDPLNPDARFYLSLSYQFSNRLAEAEAEAKEIISLSPQGIFAHSFLGMIQMLQGRLDEALATAAKEPEDMYRLQAIAIIQHARGRTNETAAALAQLIERFADIGPYGLAWVYAQLNDRDRAFQWLERARQVRDPGLSWVKADTLFANLHPDVRWPEFLRSIGLADDQLK